MAFVWFVVRFFLAVWITQLFWVVWSLRQDIPALAVSAWRRRHGDHN